MSASALPVCSDVDVQVFMWCQCGQSFQTSLPYKDISAENIYDLNLRVWAHVQGAPRGKWGPYHMSWEDVTKARVTIHNDEITEDYKMPKLSGSHPLLCGVVPLVLAHGGDDPDQPLAEPSPARTRSRTPHQHCVALTGCFVRLCSGASCCYNVNVGVSHVPELFLRRMG